MPSEFSAGPFVAVLESRRLLSPDLMDLVFAMRDPAVLPFQPGQFVSILLGRNAQGVTLKRSYSLASFPNENQRLRFIVRLIPNGLASTFFLDLDPGSDVHMTGPHGFFVLNADHPGDIVFGATGTGTAAVMPMLNELAGRPSPEKRKLFWGVRHESDLFARDEIQSLCQRARTELCVCVTAPSADWVGNVGRINGWIQSEFENWSSPTFYLVGNGAMIADVKRELVARGVDRRKFIRTEAFFD